MSTLLNYLLLALLLGVITLAQDTSIVYPTTAAPSATVLPSASGYSYAGCWNETTGVTAADGERALQLGTNSANNTMTALDCIEFCVAGASQNGSSPPLQYAGLEYGRECWCGSYLSSFSEKLDDAARCNFACNGNASEICGGQLALTLYNLTDASQVGNAWSLASNGAAWWALASAVTLLFAAVL